MKRISILLVLVIPIAVFALPGLLSAQGVTQISVATLDESTFVTVQETGSGDVLFLYRVKGDRIVLVDTVFNSTSRDLNLPKHYLHKVEVDNR